MPGNNHFTTTRARRALDEPQWLIQLDYLPIWIFEMPKIIKVNIGPDIVGPGVTSPYMHYELAQPCWLVNGHPAGAYPRVWLDGEMVSLRRFIYSQEICPIPPWIRLWSSCEESGCVQPKHLGERNSYINKLIEFGNRREDREEIMDMVSTPTALLRKAMQDGFLSAGIATVHEYEAFEEHCRQVGKPFIASYPLMRAIRIQSLPATFNVNNLAALQVLASYHGNPKATLSEAPEGLRIGNLRAGHVTGLASAVADYFAGELGLNEQSSPAHEQIKALLTGTAPVTPAAEVLSLLLLETPIPEKGERASTLMHRFNKFQRSTNPTAPDISNRALAPLLEAAGLSRKRTSVGYLWLEQ